MRISELKDTALYLVVRLPEPNSTNDLDKSGYVEGGSHSRVPKLYLKKDAVRILKKKVRYWGNTKKEWDAYCADPQNWEHEFLSVRKSWHIDKAEEQRLLDLYRPKNPNACLWRIVEVPVYSALEPKNLLDKCLTLEEVERMAYQEKEKKKDPYAST
jgi:hypothetical protein